MIDDLQDDPTDIDELMRRINEDIAECKAKYIDDQGVPAIVKPKNIDATVAYHREQRRKRAAGVKTKKSDGDGPKLDINSLLQKPVFKMKRRV